MVVAIAAGYPREPDDEGVNPRAYHLSGCGQRLVLLGQALLLGCGLRCGRWTTVPLCHVGVGEVRLVGLLLLFLLPAF